MSAVQAIATRQHMGFPQHRCPDHRWKRDQERRGQAPPLRVIPAPAKPWWEHNKGIVYERASIAGNIWLYWQEAGGKWWIRQMKKNSAAARGPMRNHMVLQVRIKHLRDEAAQAIIFTSAAETLSPAELKAASAAQVKRMFPVIGRTLDEVKPQDLQTTDLALADLDALAAKLKTADINKPKAPVDLGELDELWAAIQDELETWQPRQRRAGLDNGYYLVLPMGKDVVLLGHPKVRSFRKLDAPGVRPKVGRGDVREFMIKVKRKRGKKRKYPKGICKMCKAPVEPSHYIEYLEQSYCNRDWPLAYARPVSDAIAIATGESKKRQVAKHGAHL